MDEIIVFLKKNATLVGILIGMLLVGTKFDPRKIKIFDFKKRVKGEDKTGKE